jgi:hypothetical protein
MGHGDVQPLPLSGPKSGDDVARSTHQPQASSDVVGRAYRENRHWRHPPGEGGGHLGDGSVAAGDNDHFPGLVEL